jgi:hypothetical protein
VLVDDVRTLLALAMEDLRQVFTSLPDDDHAFVGTEISGVLVDTARLRATVREYRKDVEYAKFPPNKVSVAEIDAGDC